ncbi:MAG: bifunctional adenosylcobinamide kinase/adenosylcobinamide-phosphate guanylyltransferase [Dehalococcoidales bacterium]|nr:bifunctional adenosylcobinamide kinase/adenosylcobinamide-phosphate guanylyltransferase [Dehalococcoidales bacterium]
MNNGRRLILILGGARGGKSTFAEQLAGELGREVLFVATAEPNDEAMQDRIAAHRRARPAHWRTAEAPAAAGAVIAKAAEGAEVVLLDCLTMLTANLLLREASEDPQADGTYDVLVAVVHGELEAIWQWFEGGRAHLIVVSNEVGMGLVPPYPLGRAYRDLLGWANRWLATRADEVYLMVAGIPVDVKALARSKGELQIGEGSG